MKIITSISQGQVRFSKKMLLNMVVFAILVYFIFHSIYGGRGLIAYFKLQAELEQAHQMLMTLRSERLEIENRTKLLRHETIDRDMLDEKIRSVLGFSMPTEKVCQRSEQSDQ